MDRNKLIADAKRDLQSFQESGKNPNYVTLSWETFGILGCQVCAGGQFLGIPLRIDPNILDGIVIFSYD